MKPWEASNGSERYHRVGGTLYVGMVRMLRIRNTLHKLLKISRKWYTFNTSNLQDHLLQVILHLERPLLRAVYILNPGVLKSAFLPSSFSRVQQNSTQRKLIGLFLVSIGCTHSQTVQNHAHLHCFYASVK